MRNFSARSQGSIFDGFLVTIGLHLCFQPLHYILFLKRAGIDWVAYFGLTQFVYVTPALLLCWIGKRTMTAIGLVIASALTLTLNELCGFGSRFNH